MCGLGNGAGGVGIKTRSRADELRSERIAFANRGVGARVASVRIIRGILLVYVFTESSKNDFVRTAAKDGSVAAFTKVLKPAKRICWPLGEKSRNNWLASSIASTTLDTLS